MQQNEAPSLGENDTCGIVRLFYAISSLQKPYVDTKVSIFDLELCLG